MTKTKATKRFWTYVKSKKKDTSNIAPLRENGTLISDAKGKANILNRQYCSVFTKDDPTVDPPSKGTSTIPTLPPIEIKQKGVEMLLKKLKPEKAAGPDNISPRVLREVAGSISKPLSEIFQHSINTGTVPKQWKTANVSPIYKKGDKHCAANYRPVSLTSICCKLCEHIIAKHIVNHLESNGLLSDAQHGFRGRRSCETQLLLFTDELARSMSNGHQIDVAVMDFSKAFDVVPHQRLLSKLDYYGIREKPLQWIESFLSNRTQQVIIESEASSPAPVTSGVPQGSVLGPILFLVFINDMPECVTSQCRLFADDSIIYREIATDLDTKTLQIDLDNLQKWEEKWGMSFNPSKCNIIHISRKRKTLITDYHIKGEKLEPVEMATYLGINITKDLTWHNQIAKSVSKGNRALGFIRRNISTSSILTKTRAYQTLVRPTVEYAATVWDPHQQHLIKSLEMVQRRAARHATHTYDPRASVTLLLEKLKWDTLEERRQKHKVSMAFKITKSLVAIPSDQFVPTAMTTRGNHTKFIQIPTRTNYYKFSFFPSVIPLWNSLPPEISASEDLEEFKRRLLSVQLRPPRN